MNWTKFVAARAIMAAVLVGTAGCAAPASDAPSSSANGLVHTKFDIRDLPVEGGWTLLEVSTSELTPLTLKAMWRDTTAGTGEAAEGACIGYYVGGVGRTYFIRPNGATLGAHITGNEPTMERVLISSRLNTADLVLREPTSVGEKVPVLVFHSRPRESLNADDFLEWSLHTPGDLQVRVAAQGRFTCVTNVNDMDGGRYLQGGRVVTGSEASSSIDVHDQGLVLLHVTADVSYSTKIVHDGRVVWQATGEAPLAEPASFYGCCLSPGSIQVRLDEFQATEPHAVAMLAMDLPSWVGDAMARDEARKP